MDHYERMVDWQDRIAYRKKRRREDKQLRGKDIHEWAESIRTGTADERYRENYSRIFGRDDATSREGSSSKDDTRQTDSREVDDQ